MAPRLYTASVVGEGVPVDELEKEQIEKVKKPRQKKEKSVEPAPIPDDGASRRAPKPEDGANVSTEGKPDKENKEEKKEKKPRTEKQIAAAERMVEARRLKKEQREKEMAEAKEKFEHEKKIAADKEAAKEAKKAAAKEKRRQSKLLKATANTTASGVAVEGEDHPMEDVQTPEKPVKRKINDDAPPKWLPTLISAIKSETGHTGSIKKLKEEAHAEAAEKWSDPLVRDRVNVIHNKAGEQVTNAIFPGRTFVRR